MRKENLYRKIKDIETIEIAKSLKDKLDYLRPNGAKIHRINRLRNEFSIRIQSAKYGLYPKEETIAKYRERNKKRLWYY